MIGNAVALMGRALDQANQFLVRELEKNGVQGIVPSHGGILVILLREKQCTMQELANRINRTKPTVTILVQKLVDYGYVTKTKNPNDNRVTFVTLTPKGEALEPIFWEISSLLNERVYGGFSPEESIQLETMLTTIYERFGEHPHIFNDEKQA
jgi:MarR family transcriptional regulator, organic hydroperoxide resistance regulator